MKKMAETVQKGDGFYLYPAIWENLIILTVSDNLVFPIGYKGAWDYLNCPLMVILWERERKI